MAFNLLNSILNASSTASSLTKQFPNGLLTSEITSLESSGVLSASDAKLARQNASMSAGLPSSALAAAASVGLSATDAAPDNSSITSAAVSPNNTADTNTITVNGDSTDNTDNRLRISALKGQADKIYGPNDRANNIMAPLHATGGFMFPYTPTVQVSGDTDWTPHALTHTNYDIYSYQRTPSATINLSGKFTVQNQREGEYALACIHFLRTMGKMYYGEQDSSDYDPQNSDQSKSNAGLPPPVLRLRGYGLYMFNNLKCVLKGYSFAFEENMDLVTIQSQTGGDVMLPPMFTLTVSLLLQQNTTRLRKDFKLDDFRTGVLMRRGTSAGGWF